MTIKQVLKECQVFAALTDAELEKIVSLAVEREYEVGATILGEGDSAEELFILQEGKVALQMTLPIAPAPMSRRVTVDVVTKSEVFGWAAIVEPYVYTFAAVCLQKTKVIAISGSKLRALLHDNHRIGYEVLKGLIKVVDSRLDDTRHLLVSERLLAPKPELVQL